MNLLETDVIKGIFNLKSNINPGPDGIPSYVLKQCQFQIAFPLYIIFNKSLASGKFLKQWKFSYVTPIYKAGSKNLVVNYRAISKMSAIPKLLELIVKDQLYFNIKERICVEQHGFMSGKSTSTNLMLFCKYVTDSFESSFQVDTIYTDFVKAFDTICHKILILKLKIFGISGTMLKWISSYLIDRTQSVKLGRYISEIYKVSSGVPQGSHLGPLLFNIFVNEIPLLFKSSQCLMYADDLKIFLRVNSRIDQQNLQDDLNSLANWCETNMLPLNIQKCNVFTAHRSLYPLTYNYHIFIKILDRKFEIRDLGVIFDPKLSFSLHFDYIISRANSMLGFVKRNCKEFKNPYTLKSVYMSLVRSILEYCSIIWCPSTSVAILRIERVQKTFTRFMVKQMNWNIETPAYQSRCALIGLDTLQKRRHIQCVLFIHDVFTYRIKCPEIISHFGIYIPERRLRLRHFFNNPRHRCNYGCNETFSRCIRLYNSISNELDLSLTRWEFKTHLLHYIR